MTRNVFDQAARYCVQCDPIGFLRWLIRGLSRALLFQGWLDTRTLPFPGGHDRTCDMVADLAEHADADRRWAVINEFQTEPETEILDRELEYVALIRRALRFGPQRRGKFQVVATLVNLTGPAQPDTLEMGLPSLDAPTLRLQVATRTLRDEDAALTLDKIAAGTTSRCLLCWISLMRGGDDPDIIARWTAIAGDEPEGTLRATYGAIVTLFAELTGCVEQWKSGLEGWNMRESTVLAEWNAEARAEGRAEGRTEGRTEGRAEGRAEGLAQGERNALLLMLGRKFGAPVATDLVAAIEAQADPDVLSRWLTSAIDAEAIEIFRKSIAL